MHRQRKSGMTRINSANCALKRDFVSSELKVGVVEHGIDFANQALIQRVASVCQIEMANASIGIGGLPSNIAKRQQRLRGATDNSLFIGVMAVTSTDVRPGASRSRPSLAIAID